MQQQGTGWVNQSNGSSGSGRRGQRQARLDYAHYAHFILKVGQDSSVGGRGLADECGSCIGLVNMPWKRPHRAFD